MLKHKVRFKNITDFSVKPFHVVQCMTCKEEFTLYRNGGNLDSAMCYCGNVFELEIGRVDLTVSTYKEEE